MKISGLGNAASKFWSALRSKLGVQHSSIRNEQDRKGLKPGALNPKALGSTLWAFFWRYGPRSVLVILTAAHLYALALKVFPVPGTVLMVQRHFSGQNIQKGWTPISKTSPYLVQAVLAGEDGRYCSHVGVDFLAIQQAHEDNKTKAKRRGGSTVTQQTAKNVFFWNGGGFIRKAGEAWAALVIDLVWGKTRVIEVYFNVVEWGDGLFGIKAAAKARFNTTPDKLTERQAALLAAVLPSPNKWRLDPPSAFVKRRADTLQARMEIIRNNGYDLCVNRGS